MEDNQNTDARSILRRKKRVRRIKRFIIILFLLMLVLPILFCFYLFQRMDRLEDRIEELKILKKNEAEANVVHAQELEDVDGMQPDGALESEATTPPTVQEEQEVLGKNVKPKKEAKKVYLTFDDGPSSLTPKVLDILKEEGVKATFFVVGKNDEASKATYRRIIEEGHVLGMHSYTHKYSYIYGSLKNYKSDLLKLRELLYETTGVQPNIYRFPGGSSTTTNKIRIKDCIKFIEKKGITYYDWNVANGDAGKKISDKQMVGNVIDNVKYFNTSIVLMHDAVDKAATIRTLPTIIKKLKQGNYEILPIDETTYPVRHNR